MRVLLSLKHYACQAKKKLAAWLGVSIVVDFGDLRGFRKNGGWGPLTVKDK